MTNGEKYTVIQAYVMGERKRRGITPRLKPPSEFSCEMAGEFFHLVEMQLLFTSQGLGAWPQLTDPEILDGAYRYVTKGRRF